MKNLLANLFVASGDAVAGVESNLCAIFFIDEPKMPKSLIK